VEKEVSTFAIKKGLAQMLKGGVIMDVVTPEHARIAEDAGAVAVMALERVPADIRAYGGVARMSDPEIILQIMDAVSIPVMAKCRIGHFVEAQILEAFNLVSRLDIDTIEVDHSAIVDLAMDTGLTTYDASYLWIALHLRGKLVTLDKTLRNAAEAKSVGIS